MRNIPIIITGLYLTALFGCQTQETERQVLFPREINTIHKIDPEKDTMLTGANGTIIEIPAQAFIGEDGRPPSGTIELTFADFYDKSDFVLNRLSTQTADGRMLQSSGMVYLDAIAGNQQLKLKDDRYVRLKFRRNFESPTAGLFYGQEDENGVIEWVETGEIYQDTFLLSIVNKYLYTGEDTIQVFDDKSINIYEEVLKYGKDFSIGIVSDHKLLIGIDTIGYDDSRSYLINQFYNKYPELIIKICTFKDSIADENFFSQQQDYYKNARNLYYTFNTKKLGWINCDEFINQETQEFNVILPQNLDKVELYAVFNSLNSVMTGNYINNQNNFSFRVPDNLDITLIAWKYDSEMPMFAMLKSNTSKRQETLALKPMPADSIKLIIQERL